MNEERPQSIYDNLVKRLGLSTWYTSFSTTTTLSVLPLDAMSQYADYKASKEAFVSGMTGSSILHVNIVSSVAFVRAMVCCFRSAAWLIRLPGITRVILYLTDTNYHSEFTPVRV